jgi:multidrug efflux pump subunit AcrB
MEGLAERIEAVLAKYPDIAHYTATVGGTSGLVGISGTNEMTLTAYLKDDRKLSTYDIVDHLRGDLANFTGADVTVVAVDSLVTAIMGNTSDMGTGGVTVSVSGADEASLRYAVQMIEEMARGVTGVISTFVLSAGAPEFVWRSTPSRLRPTADSASVLAQADMP